MCLLHQKHNTRFQLVQRIHRAGLHVRQVLHLGQSSLARPYATDRTRHTNLPPKHLWPNARNEYDARNNDENRRRTNLYGIFLESSPLHYISKIDDIAAGNMKPAHIWYFENMSRAMGRMCSGQIYLVTDMRENLDLTQFKQGQRYWPNIWASTEWPELGNGITAHRVKDEFLIVVDFARIPYPRPVAWKVHWRRLTKTGDMGTMWTRSNGTHGEYRVPDHWEPYDLAGELSGGHESRMQRRASCLEDTGIDSEPNGMYFFG